jgi:hypothetical protein
MTDDEREHLKILSTAVEDANTRLQGLELRNTYNMTHLERIDHSAAIYEAEIEYARAMGKVRAFQRLMAAR